ncbi:substrate-binding domain-containing protein [Deinococcus deserti]|uniref:Putative Transcriptional regulator, LacI family n=1 Tax=Deinococcus deserti (strain DSM 17065 / CIP 109153 / LMG 22923 / VCD115) TaxID=546414 RepID=C1CYC1_DEIDV|nr:substrate-binding domain-containing protein [Deinococcus deserti]ACO44942.2 putative Transcriptional regulator, LacI family [Deinococcus deserti VCD115]
MPPARPPAGPRPGPASAGSGRVTLKDVARHLGVSVATVSNAYNRPDQLSLELRERILKGAHELGYSGPDPLARSLRRGRTGVIGVVYDAPLDYAFADPAAALFLGSVAHTIQEQGLNLLLLACPHGPQPVHGASVDGFIVYCAAQGSELLRAVLGRQLPTVLVDQHPVGGAMLVGIEDAAGARAAAAHLAALGHTHIGVLCLGLNQPGSLGATPEGSYRTTTERLNGYRQGAPQATLFLVETLQNTPEEGERRAREVLQAQPEVTALLCMSDVLAQGALHAARQLELVVPADLSVIGFDDLPSSASLDLTTVWQPTSDKGEQVGQAVLALLRGDHPADVTLPTRLVLRGTTAPASRSSQDQSTGDG